MLRWSKCFISLSEAEISHDKPSLENPVNKVTNDTKDENEEDDYDYDYDEEEDWDWNESGGGDFTKRYAAMRTGYNQQVLMSRREGLWETTTLCGSMCMMICECCLFLPG